VFYHTLGTPADADTYVIGKEFPRIAEVFLDSSPDGRYLLATVQNGDSGDFEHHLLGPNGSWTRSTTYADQINAVAFGDGDDRHLYLVSYKDAPKGRILRMPLADPQLSKAVTVVPESDVAIVGLRWQGTRMVASHIPTANGLYVLDSTGGPSQLRYFPRDGGQATTLPLPPVCDVREMVHLAGDDVLLNIVTYTAPAAWFTYQPGDKQLHETALRRNPPASFADIKVERVFATSRDGTKVPMTVMYPSSVKLDGGLLMGVELTQHPELFRAVVSHVGIYDMLRSELSANGTFNIPEFGTVKEPAEFKALYAYSPLHHVQDHTNYPAVLLLTGVNDGRVDPANSYKMAARLQTATTGPRPILLRVTFESGHGLGASLSEEIDQKADVYAFLFEQLGIDARAAK
jgi:prolyl oligopeptidase PreP (S9A serine peptidase family)